VVLGSLLMPTAASSAGVCVDMNTISFKTLTFPGSKINYYRPIQPGVPDTDKPSGQIEIDCSLVGVENSVVAYMQALQRYSSLQKSDNLCEGLVLDVAGIKCTTTKITKY